MGWRECARTIRQLFVVTQDCQSADGGQVDSVCERLALFVSVTTRHRDRRQRQNYTLAFINRLKVYRLTGTSATTMRSSQHLLDARHRSLAPASRNPSGVDTQFGVAVDGGYFVYDRRSAIVVSLLAAIIIRLDDHVHAESYATTR